MAGKKLNRTEIATLAKRILQEVNEVNQVYNESVKADPKYIAELEKIKSQDPCVKIKEDAEKALKVIFGKKWNENINFNISLNNYHEITNKIKNEINDLNDKSLKKIYNTSLSPVYLSNKDLDRIIDDITISQITISDVQLLINSIKAKLL